MRVDRVQVAIDGYIEFEGPVNIRMDWHPEPDDPLVALLLERHDQTLWADARAAGEAKGIL